MSPRADSPSMSRLSDMAACGCPGKVSACPRSGIIGARPCLALAIAALFCQRNLLLRSYGTIMTLSAEPARQEGAFPHGAPGGPLWHFLRGFLKHPVMVGSVIPSSQILIQKMLVPVAWAHTRLSVEYGPGDGTITPHERKGV